MMKKLLNTLKNKISYILSNKKYLQMISFILFLISLYTFSSYLNISIYSDEKKHLRNLESTINETINETSKKIEKANNNSNLNDYNYTNSDDINHILINDSNIDNYNISNGELNIAIKVRQLTKNLTEKIMLYEFIKNITTGFYYGDWNSLSVKKNRFHDTKGEGYLNFFRKSDSNYIINLGESKNSSKITVYFTLKDGEYIDDYLEGNFTFTLEDISLIDLKNESISFVLHDVPVSY